MRRISTLCKDGLVGGGITLLVVMAFPIVFLMLFLMLFTLRFALVAGGTLALVSIVVAATGDGLGYAFEPSVRAWERAPTERQFG